MLISRTATFCAVCLISLLLAACGAAVVEGGALPETPELPPRASSTSTSVTIPTASLTPAPSPATATLALPTTSPTPEPPAPTDDPLITLLFTGAIVPARCVQAAVDERGTADYLYANVSGLLSAADLAVGTLNATLSDFTPRTGCVSTFSLLGSPNHADAMAAAGFDAMSVATNHIKNCGLSNCGDRAFFDTLDNLWRVDIVPIGAGESLHDAMQPAVFEIQGVRFGIVSLGEIEAMTFAGQDTPGIAVLSEENLRAAILAAQQVADVVIAMPHWGPEYSLNPNWNQRTYAGVAVDAGADLVVGNHTHVAQAYQEIDGVPVFYGLGSMVFDQTWARENMQSLILMAYFKGVEYVGYELVPLVTDGDGTVNYAGEQEGAEILERIRQASEALR